MRYDRYPDCRGGAGCPARWGGRAVCGRCQPVSPFGFAPVSGPGMDRLLFGHR